MRTEIQVDGKTYVRLSTIKSHFSAIWLRKLAQAGRIPVIRNGTQGTYYAEMPRTLDILTGKQEQTRGKELLAGL